LTERSDELLVSQVFATRQAITLGETLEVEVGRRTRLFRVVGIIDDESLYLGSTTVGKLFVADEALALMLGSGDQAGFFALQLDDRSPTAVDRTLEQLQRRFKQLGPGVVAAYEDREASLRAVRILSLMLTAMVVIIGLIAAIGIANTLAMNVVERRRELGVMRALGGSAAALARLLALEASLVGLAGALLGLALGYPLARLLVGLTGDALFRLTFLLPPSLLLLTLGMAQLLAIVAALAPGLAAGRLRVAETLRYE
jgi:putative ABC transport system permease protein